MARAEKSVDAVQGSTKQAHSDVRGIQERVDTLSANFAKTSYSVTKLDQDVGTLGRRINDASTSLQHVSAMVDDFNVERVLVAVDFAKFVAKSTLPKGPSELVDLLVALGFNRLYDSLALKNVVFADGPYKSGSFTVDRAVGYCLAVEDTNVVLLAFIHRRNLLYKAEKRDGLIGDPHTVLTVIGVVQDGTVAQTISLLVGPLNGPPVIADVYLQQQLKAVVRGLLFDQPSYNNLLLCIEPNTYLQRTELIKQFVANETLATQPRVHNTDQFWMFTDLGDRSSFESYELRAYQNANLPVSAESGLLFAAVVSETVQFKDYRKIMNWA